MDSKKAKVIGSAAVLAIGVFSAPSAISASDYFLKLGDIKGESLVREHKDEIEVLSWSWGVSRSETKTKRRASKLCVEGLTVHKELDSATSEILTGVAVGEVFPSAKLALVRDEAEEPFDLMVLEMRNVLVTSVSLGGESGSEGPPVETLTLNFEEVEVTYNRQSPRGELIPSASAVLSGNSSACK